MIEIITNVATFGGWKDCYYFMIEFNLLEIEIIEIKYCTNKIFDSSKFTLEEVRKIAFDEVE